VERVVINSADHDDHGVEVSLGRPPPWLPAACGRADGLPSAFANRTAAERRSTFDRVFFDFAKTGFRAF
jgi:hypothetical protein